MIDQGLQVIRQLWDAGLAHRDIKPANLLVRDGQLILIDVAFAQVRPSPWRQAIDLANMMLVLAVRTDAETVYRRALDYFTPDEIAEAFAAARGVASPSQLRTVMKQDGRDLLSQFRQLAPHRRPFSLQRWGLERAFLEHTHQPIAIWQIPLGNSTLPDEWGAFKDTRVETWLGQRPRLVQLRDAGVVALLFGGGADGTTSPQTDGGLFFRLSAAYYRDPLSD